MNISSSRYLSFCIDVQFTIRLPLFDSLSSENLMPQFQQQFHSECCGSNNIDVYLDMVSADEANSEYQSSVFMSAKSSVVNRTGSPDTDFVRKRA